jgi:hypothetical protein
LVFGIDCRVPFGFAPQTSAETGVEVDFRMPFRVAIETTLGIVPGTVPTAIPGISLGSTSPAPKVIYFGYLDRLRLV